MLMEEALSGIVSGDVMKFTLKLEPAIMHRYQRWYENLNFQVKSRLRAYYRDGREDAFLMALELS